MKVDVPVHAIIAKDEDSGEQQTVTTLRTASEIAEMVEETEKDLIDEAMREKGLLGNGHQATDCRVHRDVAA
jgi:hypothetical protein